MHAVPGGDRLDVARDGAPRPGRRAGGGDRHADRRQQGDRRPYDLCAWRRGGLADPGPGPPFPADDRAADRVPSQPEDGRGVSTVAMAPLIGGGREWIGKIFFALALLWSG